MTFLQLILDMQFNSLMKKRKDKLSVEVLIGMSTFTPQVHRMAPEIIRGEKYGKLVDIWSLGIMLMECCDLQVKFSEHRSDIEPPYITESPNKALLLITQGPPPPLKKVG